ncbi:hypothetical protein IU433_26975 [Nocardia puris]|uniref:Uncharacterized protein n=1 Tax=Nocardia puris TaxID=208602 RepID=A0A366DJN4_9NOCA|nr:hypothetical protein [Nocardia puris]MBF6213036.1 hypothetical protein [Nocardia puris]MBF6368027.1 hypothetical protein [Nocardia puris]MBF6462660.1 hypothetical protein [Nocardia puris]RBO90283.1 hypothetical protein DFR74_106168 [Nocardia puris]
MNDPEPMLDVARGDAAVSRQVGEALRIIAHHSRDEDLKRQIREILAGNGSVRDLARTDPFNRILDGVLPTAMQELAELSEDERERLAEEGRAELERYRDTTAPPPAPEADQPPAEPAPQDPVLPGTRKPNRDQIVTPDVPDSDDDYFSERRQRGWLQ